MDFFDFLIFALIFLFPLVQQILQKRKKAARRAQGSDAASPSNTPKQIPSEQLPLQAALQEIRAALGVPPETQKPTEARKPDVPRRAKAPSSSPPPPEPQQGWFPPHPSSRPQKPKQRPALPTPPPPAPKQPSAGPLPSVLLNLQDPKQKRDAILLSEILGPPRSLRNRR